ncbi:MAG: phasin family protein [Alcanivoracaceae bacterium]|nr:phasin family protein [Alcanivoracaceae bacterium]
MTEKKTIKKTLKKKASVKKTESTTSTQKANVAENIMGSANEIWLAGLGAFAKAQQEGVKIFNKLVDEGKDVEKVIKKSSKTASKEVKSTVDKVKGKASKSWDKLENIFESRVEKALQKLDVPTSAEISTLLAKVEALATEVSRLTGSYVDDVKTAVKETSKKEAPATNNKVAKKTVAKTKESKK